MLLIKFNYISDKMTPMQVYTPKRSPTHSINSIYVHEKAETVI